MVDLRIRIGSLGRYTIGSSEAVTGLDFPANTTAAATVYFIWSAANTPDITPLTVMYRTAPKAQSAGPVSNSRYYTGWFIGNISTGDPFSFLFLNPYVGCHPFPNPSPSGTSSNWEIAIQQGDITTDDNGNSTDVVKDGTSYSQASVVTRIGNELRAKYYWHLRSNVNKVITYDSVDSYANRGGGPGSAYGMCFGAAPWNPGNEEGCSIIRGIQVFQAALTLTQIQALEGVESNAAALVTAANQGVSHWYLNINPTPSDITDKSGNNRNPSWANANRPALWAA